MLFNKYIYIFNFFFFFLKRKIKIIEFNNKKEMMKI